MFPFPGLNLALTTPFDDRGRVDLDVLEGRLERYLAAGVEGFVLSGTGRSFDARFPDLAELPSRTAGPAASASAATTSPPSARSSRASSPPAAATATVKSTLAGMLAADLAVGVPSDELARYMDQPQPTCLPPEPVAWLGTNAVIRWHELHAGREG